MSGEHAHRPWSLLVDAPRPGWENMAVDCALLDLADAEGACVLRLYSWAPHCLSFGRHEPASRRYDRERIEALGLDCVRRPTGGRAVWHARELTYSVAAPLGAFGGLREAYRALHEILAAALLKLGAQPALATAAAPPGPAAGPCFNAPVGGEVILGGSKVVGSAQLRQGDAFLQHGSLLLEDDQATARELAGLTDGPRTETSLSAALGRVVRFEEAASAVAESAAARLGLFATPASLRAAIMTGAARHAGRFRDPRWTWER